MKAEKLTFATFAMTVIAKMLNEIISFWPVKHFTMQSVKNRAANSMRIRESILATILVTYRYENLNFCH